MTAVNLFIGDSHTCGYHSIPGKSGLGSYSIWQENNYAKKYAEITKQKSVVYAMPGAHSDAYTNWLKILLDKNETVNKVFISLSGFNRFTIAGNNGKFGRDPISLDHFTVKAANEELFEAYIDDIINGDYFQLYQKTIQDDYDNFPGIQWSEEKGLISPNLRKNTFMQIKTFLDLNTHLETQNFLKNVFIWDNLCRLRNVKLYIFQITDRLQFPTVFDYYGPLNNTIISQDSVQTYFSKKNIDHKRFLIADKEHYDKEYHNLIAEKFIPHLTKT